MWCVRTSKVNLFGWGRRVALGVFPNGSTGWILSHSSSSRGLFPPCRNVVIIRISYIFSELAKKRQPWRVKGADLSLWPLGAQWNIFLFLLEWPVLVLLTLKRVGAVTPERSRPVGVATATALPLVLRENRGRVEQHPVCDPLEPFALFIAGFSVRDSM